TAAFVRRAESRGGEGGEGGQGYEGGEGNEGNEGYEGEAPDGRWDDGGRHVAGRQRLLGRRQEEDAARDRARPVSEDSPELQQIPVHRQAESGKPPCHTNSDSRSHDVRRSARWATGSACSPSRASSAVRSRRQRGRPACIIRRR